MKGIRTSVACVGVLGCAMAVWATTYAPVVDDPSEGPVHRCGAWCNGQWRYTGSFTCASNKTCCGYYNCDNDTYQVTCCTDGETHCFYDGSTQPPTWGCLPGA